LALLIYKTKKASNQINKGYFILFLLLGFAGSLPLMVTLVQRNFYFIPALPMFAIAWALLIADGLNNAFNQLNQQHKLKNGITIFAGLALIAGVATTTVFA
jgi:hypothetical protein